MNYAGKGLCALLLVFLLAPMQANAQIELIDDLGNQVKLEKPAQRIISLAPHITEMLYAAGGGGQIVGTVSYSDYPEAARQIRRVGDATNLDLEAVAALAPDLILAWHSGTPAQTVANLRNLGFTVYLSEPQGLAGVAASLRKLGALVGNKKAAESSASQFLERLDKLSLSYRSRKPITVFYQIWNQPLMTINSEHVISDVINLCGGINLFDELPALAPAIDLEVVLLKNPEVILISSQGLTDTEATAEWRRWRSVTAVRENQIYPIPWDLISRYTSRLLEGAKVVCEAIDRAR